MRSLAILRLRCLQEALKQNLKPPEKPWFDFGAGINLELDEGSLAPTMRLKVKDFFSIKVNAFLLLCWGRRSRA